MGSDSFFFSLFTEKLVDLMVTIVELSPSCCKSSHLPVLFAAYSATLSATGEHTLSFLYLPFLQ